MVLSTMTEADGPTARCATPLLRMATDWTIGDGWMRAKVRRLVDRARDASGEEPDNAGPGMP